MLYFLAPCLAWSITVFIYSLEGIFAVGEYPHLLGLCLNISVDNLVALDKAIIFASVATIVFPR